MNRLFGWRLAACGVVTLVVGCAGGTGGTAPCAAAAKSVAAWRADLLAGAREVRSVTRTPTRIEWRVTPRPESERSVVVVLVRDRGDRADEWFNTANGCQ